MKGFVEPNAGSLSDDPRYVTPVKFAFLSEENRLVVNPEQAGTCEELTTALGNVDQPGVENLAAADKELNALDKGQSAVCPPLWCVDRPSRAPAFA